jgi:hypothetical protein
VITNLKQKFLLLIIAVAPFSLFALDKQVVGKWNDLDGKTIIEFSVDKVILYTEIISNDGSGYAVEEEVELIYMDADTTAYGRYGNMWMGGYIDVYFHLLSANVLLLLIRDNTYEMTTYDPKTGGEYREHEETHRLILLRG